MEEMKMKKNMFSLLAVAAIAAVSCVKENNPATAPQENPNLAEVTLTAGTETKAAFDTEKYPQIKWEGNESISVLGANTGNQEFKTTATGMTAEFTGLADLTDDVLYAVYPYDANIALDGENLRDVTIPAVQTATAGSFDPKAYVAVARCEDKSTLSFKSLVSFLKFSLDADAAANAKSVTIVANNGTENLACTSGSTSVTAVSHGAPYTNVSTSVTLKGEFVSGKDYFMTIRPNDIDGGITLYVEYADGSVYKKSTDKTLFPTAGQRRNHVLPLGTVKKSDLTMVNDLYALYNMGYDINVGGKFYNKSTHTATLVTATEASTSLYSQINTGGLYFIETSGEGSFNLHSNVAATKDVILIGNSADVKVNVDFNGKNVNHAAGTIALKNIALDVDTHTNYVFANNNATTDTDGFILDNCAVNGLVKPLYYVNVTDYTCKSITMIDTDVQLGAATNIIDLSKTTSLGNESVNICNCIFYAANNTVSRIVNNSQSLTSYTADVNFKNNTVFNLHAGTGNGLLHMAGANSIVFCNNLINFYSLNSTEYVIRAWKNTPSYTVDNNFFWARATSGIPDDLIFYNSVKVESAEAVITSDSYPYASKITTAGATR